jgi:hypothetical protein
MTNLPAAYANMIGYSDIAPFEVLSISKSGKQITIRAMKADRDLAWKPEFHAGGFVANCSNQQDQKWVIEADAGGAVLKAHKRADGYFWSAWGKHRIEAAPRKFYDYNF